LATDSVTLKDFLKLKDGEQRRIPRAELVQFLTQNNATPE
jgi:hypothetical protein